MRLALLSDVHANLPALRAVIDRLEGVDVDAVVCLGDLVGYNAHPTECVTLLREIGARIVKGNHDEDVATPRERPLGVSTSAAAVNAWTRERMREDDLAYLRALPAKIVHEGWVAVHGCFLNDVYFTGYVTDTMTERNLRSLTERSDLAPIGFCGHTHVPMFAALVGDRVLSCAREWPASASAVLINPGAVGQPRDRDPRASFAIVDTGERTVRFERVPYDVDATRRAIARAGLPAALADRLLEGA